MALAYSPSTQEDGSEYGTFQISLGYLWKPRHTYMGKLRQGRISGFPKITEPTTVEAELQLSCSWSEWQNPVQNSVPLLSVGTMSYTGAESLLLWFGLFPSFTLPGDRTAILKTIILTLLHSYIVENILWFIWLNSKKWTRRKDLKKQATAWESLCALKTCF